MIYGCGCVNEVDADSGVLKSVSKCEFHLEHSRTHPEGETIEYFKELGCFDEQGIPQNQRLINELLDPLLEMQEPLPHTALPVRVLEIGCGLGAYIPLFRRCSYIGVEKSRFACQWVENCFDAIVSNCMFEDYELSYERFGLILAAHVFEHMKDAPYQLQRCFAALELGGKIIIIVPDDTDPTNPDHRWFFTVPTLHALLEKIGFVNIKSTMRKRVPQENFIYCVAEKP